MSVQRARTVAIIQARMGSTRLPGKVLADIAGKPMLVRVYERARRSRKLDDVVIATTTDLEDAPIVDLCRSRGYKYARGHPADVLDRFMQTAREYRAEIIVRLTADCPLLDPVLIDETVTAFFEADPPVDFAANRLPHRRTYPIGLDTEVCSRKALEIAWRRAKEPYQREHVMPYLYEPNNEFRVLLLESESDHGDLRWTVDTAEDLEFVRQVYLHLGDREDFTWGDVLALYERYPALRQINARVPHKGVQDVDDRPVW